MLRHLYQVHFLSVFSDLELLIDQSLPQVNMSCSKVLDSPNKNTKEVSLQAPRNILFIVWEYVNCYGFVSAPFHIRVSNI